MTAKEQIEHWASKVGIGAIDLAKMTVVEFVERVDTMLAKREADRHAAELATHCECVRLNRTIGIYHLGDQSRAARNGLGAGPVADTYSAAWSCTKCKGSGRKA